MMEIIGYIYMWDIFRNVPCLPHTQYHQSTPRVSYYMRVLSCTGYYSKLVHLREYVDFVTFSVHSFAAHANDDLK